MFVKVPGHLAAVAEAAVAVTVRRYTGHSLPDGPLLSMPVLPFAEPFQDLTAIVRDGGIAIEGCPGELAPFFAADLATVFEEITSPSSSTAGLLSRSAYERRSAPVLQESETICAVFARQVALHPDKQAVLADDGSLTYRELGSAVAATAAAIPAGARAAVLCRHGANTIIGLLAGLVSGRAYVPLEPSFPEQRLAQIVADSEADIVITDEEHASLAHDLGLRTIHIRSTGEGTLESSARPDDPAYLLYTSGSTGAPKGVVQSHRNVLFGIANHVRNFGITTDDRTSVLTSFGYDMAVTDLFSAILSGAAAVPVDIRTHGLGHLAQTLAKHRVTIYHSTPTVYRYLLASLGESGRLPSVRSVVLGGEEVTRHDVELARRHFSSDVVFVNGYGTTEISFAAQNHLGPQASLDHAVVPIGRPLDGVDIVLVDPLNRPACLTGEVVVRCPHVALGYWRMPELTATRFIEYDGVRAYRTGDAAHRLPDGTLVFAGRADRMVKIRGYRVELGEIEAQLAALPGVGHAAVIARTGARADKEILAYAVPARDATLDPAAIRCALAAVVPEFMLPRGVMVVDELPIGPTGKLDVNALPVEAATDPLEQTIAGIWSEVLGVPNVGRDTAFFELGGHSLLMALIQQRIEAVLGRRVALAVLFEHATVARLTAYLKSGTQSHAIDRATERMRQRREARQAA